MKTKAAALIALLAFTCAGCSDGSGPHVSLVGDWDFVGFTDAGVEAATTGTWTFEANGSLSVRGTVTFPGEPTDSIVASGSYSQQGSRVQLTIAADTGSWAIADAGDVVVLTEIEPPPANVIRLRRR